MSAYGGGGLFLHALRVSTKILIATILENQPFSPFFFNDGNMARFALYANSY